MGDVLTQSQIDALLSSVQESGKFENAQAEKTETPKQKYRKYNFHTPKKFTKDRLKLLRSVYENYARLISSHLTSLLRIGCEVELFEVEEQRYYEFNNALADDNLLAFIDVQLGENEESEEEPALMVMTDTVMYTMLDRMLGGSGKRSTIDSDGEEQGGAPTDIEIAVYETILQHIAPIMNDVWQNYLFINFKYHKMESNPNLIQVMPIDEIVVIVTFNITVMDTAGQISVCLPGGILETIFRKFEQVAFVGTRRKESQTSKEKENILKGIENSILEVKAEFEQSTILLEELYSMNVGDYLNLNLPKDSEININIGGKPWFKGQLGAYKEHVAVKLTAMYKEQQIKSAGGEGNE